MWEYLKREKIKVFLVSIMMIAILLCGNGRVQAAQDSWVNPIYEGNYKSADSKSLRVMDAPTLYTVSNLTELEETLKQAFLRREISISITYTGHSSDLNQLDSMIDALLAADDYLRFSIGERSYRGKGYEGNYQLSFVFNYLTTLEQENYIDQQITDIQARIISTGMNAHQIEKAIHDYIVLTVYCRCRVCNNFQ